MRLPKILRLGACSAPQDLLAEFGEGKGVGMKKEKRKEHRKEVIKRNGKGRRGQLASKNLSYRFGQCFVTLAQHNVNYTYVMSLPVCLSVSASVRRSAVLNVYILDAILIRCCIDFCEIKTCYNIALVRKSNVLFFYCFRCVGFARSSKILSQCRQRIFWRSRFSLINRPLFEQ